MKLKDQLKESVKLLKENGFDDIVDIFFKHRNPKSMKFKHNEHCCIIHGCQQDFEHPTTNHSAIDNECPVATGMLQQKHGCQHGCINDKTTMKEIHDAFEDKQHHHDAAIHDRYYTCVK